MRKLLLLGMIPFTSAITFASETPTFTKIQVGPCEGSKCKVEATGDTVQASGSVTIEEEVSPATEPLTDEEPKVIVEEDVATETARNAAIKSRFDQLSIAATEDEVSALTKATDNKSLLRVVGLTEIFITLREAEDSTLQEKVKTAQLLLDVYMVRKLSKYKKDTVLSLDQIKDLAKEAEEKAAPVLAEASSRRLDPEQTVQLVKVYLKLQASDPNATVQDALKVVEENPGAQTKELLAEIPLPNATDIAQEPTRDDVSEPTPAPTPVAEDEAPSSPSEKTERKPGFLDKLVASVQEKVEEKTPELVEKVTDAVAGN